MSITKERKDKTVVGIGSRNKTSMGLISLVRSWGCGVHDWAVAACESPDFIFAPEGNAELIFKTPRDLGIDSDCSMGDIFSKLRQNGLQPLIHEVAFRMCSPTVENFPEGETFVCAQPVETEQGKLVFYLDKVPGGGMMLDAITASNQISPDARFVFTEL
jgi:hypothetical protein